MIGGPTAIGKSKLSLSMRETLNGVLVNADATKLYRGLFCGANKTPLKDEDVRLWDLVDACDKGAEFSAGQYHDTAVAELQHIINTENKTPIVVGGSGLYLRWLLRGKQAGPKRDVSRSREIYDTISQMPWSEVSSLLQQLDPSYGSKIGTNDYRRAARALELVETTGHIVSDLQRQRTLPLHDILDESRDVVSNNVQKDAAIATSGLKWQDSIDFRPFVVTMPRTELYDKICRRCEHMVLDGLLMEVWTLMKHGLTAESTPGKAIGYRQTIDFLNSKIFTEDTFMSYVIDFQSKTRQLAHRQLAWFRKEPDFLNIDLNENTAQEMTELVRLPQQDWMNLVRKQKIPTSEELAADLAPLRGYLPPTGLLLLPNLTKKQKGPEYFKMAETRAQFIERQLSLLEQIKYEMDRLGYPAQNKNEANACQDDASQA